MQKMLTLCTCPQLQPERSQQLAQHAITFNQWVELPAQAEAQGIGPLVYTYLQQVRTLIPHEDKVALQGLYLRHRYTDQVRSQVLRRDMESFRGCRN